MFTHSNHIYLSIYTLIILFKYTECKIEPNRMQTNPTLGQLGLEHKCLPRGKTRHSLGGC